MRDKDCKYPCLMEFFEDGYGEDLAQTLADSIERYVQGLEAAGESMSRTDVTNIGNLVWLLKAVLKDVHGLDLK